MSSPTNVKLRVENASNVLHQDNADTYAVGDRQGAQLFSQQNAPYYNAASRGKVFHGMSVTAGHVIPADNATAPTYAVWNPSGSNVNLVPLVFRYGTITLGTRVVSALGFNIVTGTSSTIGDGTPVTAFAGTPTAIKGADWTTQGGAASKALFSNAGTVTVTATLNFFVTGVHYDLATVGGEAALGKIVFDGDWIVAPGTLIFPAFHAAASGSTYLCQLTWMEVPIA